MPENANATLQRIQTDLLRIEQTIDDHATALHRIDWRDSSACDLLDIAEARNHLDEAYLEVQRARAILHRLTIA